MGPTNQQLADLMSQIIKSTSAHTTAFTGAVEKLIENDNRHHEQFRQTIQKIDRQQAVNCQEIAQHKINWDRFWKIIAAAVLVPIVLAILQFVFK